MTYKALKTNDTVSTRTLLHEAIPLTGTIVSGTYADANIKDYGHLMFQSVYDYPYLSSSANHIFDITTGIAANSNLYSKVVSQQTKKKNIYNQMSQVLMGYDATGSIQQLDEDGDLIAGGNKLKEVINTQKLNYDGFGEKTILETMNNYLESPAYTSRAGIVEEYGFPASTQAFAGTLEIVALPLFSVPLTLITVGKSAVPLLSVSSNTYTKNPCPAAIDVPEFEISLRAVQLWPEIFRVHTFAVAVVMSAPVIP